MHALVLARFIRQQQTNNINFIKRLLFIDEACMIRKGILNVGNMHMFLLYFCSNPEKLNLTTFILPPEGADIFCSLFYRKCLNF